MTKMNATLIAEEQNYGGRIKQQRTKFRTKIQETSQYNPTDKKNNKKPKDRSSLRNMFA